MKRLSNALLQHLLEHFEDEIKDIDAYGALADKAEEDGDDMTALTLQLIQHDEYTHADALHDILEEQASELLDSKEGLREKWHKAKRKIWEK